MNNGKNNKKFFKKINTKVSAIKNTKLFEPDKNSFVGLIYQDELSQINIAVHKETGEVNFVKICSKEKLIEFKQVNHVFNEIRSYNDIEYEFFPQFNGFYQDNKFVYIATEFVVGGSLFNYLRRSEMFDLCETNLEYLHQKRICFRNLKPENIYIDKEGFIKLCDLSFTKMIGDDVTYSICGTPNYMGPEMIIHKGYSFGVDWWAVGIMIYEFIVGIDPFADEDIMVIYEKILKSNPLFPENIDRYVINNIDLFLLISTAKSLIMHILDKDLTKRYGCLKNSSSDIKNHRFFSGFDWLCILNHTYKPKFIPLIKKNDDFSYYDFMNIQPIFVNSIEKDNDPFYNY